MKIGDCYFDKRPFTDFDDRQTCCQYRDLK